MNDNTQMQRILRDNYEQLHTNILDNLEKMNKPRNIELTRA